MDSIGSTYHNNLAIDGSLSCRGGNFTNERSTIISGFKLYPNLTGIPGWNITLYNQTGGDVLFDSQLTGSDGSYNFTGLPYGVTFNVSEVIQPGWTPIGATYHNNLAIDGSLSYINQNFTNERQLGNISGSKYNDLNGNGIKEITDVPMPGVVITLYYQNGTLFGTQTTNANGRYVFYPVPLGSTFLMKQSLQAGNRPSLPAELRYYSELNQWHFHHGFWEPRITTTMFLPNESIFHLECSAITCSNNQIYRCLRG